MKYIIKNSDLFINKKLHPEGSEVELTKEQTKGIESFLIPVSSPEFISGSSSVSESSTEYETVTKNDIKFKNKGNKK
jgi:hypothetical protein